MKSLLQLPLPLNPSLCLQSVFVLFLSHCDAWRARNLGFLCCPLRNSVRAPSVCSRLPRQAFRKSRIQLLSNLQKPTDCASVSDDIESLQAQLDEAVSQERYGDAARLRDTIRAINSTDGGELDGQPISFWCLHRRGESIDAIRKKCQVVFCSRLVVRWAQSLMSHVDPD